jgi:hypothetical protein
LNRRFLESRKVARPKGDAGPIPVTDSVTPVAKSRFAETPSRGSRAFFSQPDEILGQVGESYDLINFTITHGPAFYLRIIPGVEHNRPLAAGDLMSKLQSVGAQVVPDDRATPEYLGNFVKSEILKWAAPIKASGVMVK